MYWWSCFAGSILLADVPKGVDVAALDGWKIVIPLNASPSEQYAAQEFQSHYADASG